MGRGPDHCSASTGGTAVGYDEDGFRTPETPVVPFAPGADEPAVSATRRMLDAAAEAMGREIDWLRVPAGPDPRDRDGEAPPTEMVQTFRRYRVGIHGPLAATRSDALALERRLRDRLGLTVTVSRHTSLRWQPSPPTRTPLDVALFRDVSAERGADEVGDSATAVSASPTTREVVEQLVDEALSYAFDRDRDTVTLAHRGDTRHGSDDSFLVWVREYVDDEYGDSVLDEATFRETGSYPEDELVLFERRVDELCRALVAEPSEYDVVLAPEPEGRSLSAVARGVAGESGPEAAVGLGDGRLVVSSRPSGEGDGSGTGDGSRTGNGSGTGDVPVSLPLAGCLLFEYLGWDDAAIALRAALSATLAERTSPAAGVGSHSRPAPETPSAFADAVVERLATPQREPGTGGVRSSPGERASIRQAIATLYNAVFADAIAPEDVELNQLLSEDEEADVSLPAVGINFYYWRRWSVERRLEVLLHELAHVEEGDGERDHGDEFYERLVELTEIAAEWQPELEAAFGESVEFDRVRRFVVDSVHEETIEPGIDVVGARKRWLRGQLSLE